MDRPEWWALHSVQSLALVLCLALAFRASRRVGPHTPYGGFLFVLALAFWFLLSGEAVFLSARAFGTWSGPGRANDALNLVGWALLAVSFFLFVSRFPRSGSRLRASGIAACAGAVGAIAGALFLAAVGQDEHGALRLSYLALDGFTLGVVAVGVERLVRLRESALGRLYALLGVALVLKTIADAWWAWLAARGETSIVPTAVYPAAGLLAVVALALHARLLASGDARSLGYDDPSLRPEQRVLRDVALQMRGLAGPWATSAVLDAASSYLAGRGVPHAIDGGILRAEMAQDEWAWTLRAGAAAAVRMLGEAAREQMRGVTRAYGPRFADLAEVEA